jgi:hypothetical protein
MAAVAHQHAATVHQLVVVEDDRKTEIAETVEEIKSQLYDILVRFRRIVRHAKDPDDSISSEHDLGKLQAMRDELQTVESCHPYCYGCSGGGFMANQQAHMGGCVDAEDDNTDIDKALNELLTK